MAIENDIAIKTILNKTEVSLILDTYDDIFSDFDPRPYDERALSEDFLSAAKRASRDKGEGLELRFLIPKNVRKSSDEDLIKERLRDHFRKHYKMLKKDAAKQRRSAFILIGIGVIVGLVDALVLSVSSVFSLSAILSDSIGLILTPASWYTIWTGFDRILSRPKEDVDDEIFYKKMKDADISFAPIDLK